MNPRLLVGTTFLLIAVAGMYAGLLVQASAPENRDESPARSNPKPAPGLELIDNLDKVIQERFLTNPNFGMRRIGPNPNPHLESFEPHTNEERQAVSDLQNEQWKVGMYLFGRRALEIPDKDRADGKRLYVEFRLNPPIPVTRNVKKRELASPKRLRDGVEEAFEKFKASDSFDFSLGKWSYAARPVRARQSCLQCHGDFFVTSKLGVKKYAYRPRRVGDSIGVLVYAVRKKD